MSDFVAQWMVGRDDVCFMVVAQRPVGECMGPLEREVAIMSYFRSTPVGFCARRPRTRDCWQGSR